MVWYGMVWHGMAWHGMAWYVRMYVLYLSVCNDCARISYEVRAYITTLFVAWYHTYVGTTWQQHFSVLGGVGGLARTGHSVDKNKAVGECVVLGLLLTHFRYPNL